jgi:biopolymer transport protein ExbB/TolQ
LLLLRDTSINHLFCGHGWVPYALVLLFFVAGWTLLLKLPLIGRESRAFALNLLPEDPDGLIDAGSGRQILGRISRLTRRQRSLMLVGRIRQGLLRLDQLGTAEKLDDLLRYRAEADGQTIDSSYAMPKFIIWAIPVLGFVGTVLGISNGVQAFSTLIQNASDLEGLRESLKGVTYGLGQAFETTMIALCMSLCLMLVMSVIQRREDRLLAALDDYCLEHLLHKIRIIAPVPAPSGALATADITALTQAIRDLTERCRELQAVQEHAAKHQKIPTPLGSR